MESVGKRKRPSYTHLRDDELGDEVDRDEPYEEPHRKTRQREQKMRWTSSEDALLQEGVSKQQRESKTPAGSIDWSVVASKLRKRDAKQCRERWVEYLNPSISRLAFTEEEDSALLELQSKHGNHWKMIHELLAERFPQRSSTAVKARWYLLRNREKRRMRLSEENNNSVPVDTLAACIPADNNDGAAATSVAAPNSAVASAALMLVNMATSSSSTTDESLATISNSTHDNNSVSLTSDLVASHQYQLPNYEYSQWQQRRVQQAMLNRNTSLLPRSSDFSTHPLTTHPSSHLYHSAAYPHYVPYSYFSAPPQMHAHHVQQLQPYYTHPLSQQSQQFQQQQYSQHHEQQQQQASPPYQPYQWKSFQDNNL